MASAHHTASLGECRSVYTAEGFANAAAKKGWVAASDAAT